MVFKSFRYRLLFMMGAITLVLASISIYTGYSYKKLVSELEQIELVHVQIFDRANKVQSHFQLQNLAWANLLLRGQDPKQYHKYLSEFYQEERLTASNARELLQSLADNKEMYKLTKSFIDNLQQHHLNYRKALRIYNQNLDSPIATDRFLAPIIQDPVAELKNIVSMIHTQQNQMIQEVQKKISARLNTLIILLIVTLLSVSLFMFWFVDRHFGRPLSRAIRTAREVSLGNLNERMKLESDNEFRIFAESFNAMVESLASMNKVLADKVSELEAEIRLREQAEAQRQEHQKELEYIVKELEAYSYSIAHDLRAPLRRISGFSSILQEDAADRLNEQDTEYLQRIINSSNHMAELIDDILTLSRVSRSEIHKTQVDLTGLVNDGFTRLKESDPKRKITLKLQPDIKVIGDPNLLKLVVDNLVGNAWKYTSKNHEAHVEFGCERRDGKCVCHIHDDGIGFDPQFSHKLFGVFQRLHRDQEFEGTGVGLATVDRIIRRHGGQVWAEGELNRGATFYFTLNAA